jgi:Rieske Fe-S protein
LKLITMAAGTAAAVVFAVPFVGYLLSALRARTEEWVPLGPVSSFPEKQTRLVTFINKLKQPWDGMAANAAVYVHHDSTKPQGQEFAVFAVNCTHLGCPVTWFPQSGLFMCPCHGGIYYENGERASGPPPRGLYHCVWKVENDKLVIQSPHLPTLQDTLRPEEKA